MWWNGADCTSVKGAGSIPQLVQRFSCFWDLLGTPFEPLTLYYRSFFYKTASVKTFMACVKCGRYEWTPPIN